MLHHPLYWPPPGESPYATTNASGAFTISAGYSCPLPTSQVYLVAFGGQIGANLPNQNLTLMSALGPCNGLSATPVVVNEVTTVASAWALAPFAASPLNSNLSSYLNIGSSSGNAAGLANAFATVHNLVNQSTGQPLSTVPAGNATVPYAEIDTLADILNACAVTTGGVAGDGSVCGRLFNDANPYVASYGTLYTGIPADTLQAMFEIAQNPDYGGTGYLAVEINLPDLFSMATPASPFQPILGTFPSDLSISLNYSEGGVVPGKGGASSFALDASGNLWIANSNTNGVTELNNLGTSITGTGSYTAASLTAPGPIAVDASGNVWVCDANGITELNFVGTEVPGSPFSGGGLTGAGCLNMAFDGLGNLWVNTGVSMAKFDSLGNPLSPSSGYTIPISPTNTTAVTLLPPLAIDNSNNVWVGVAPPAGLGLAPAIQLAELNNANGSPNLLNFLGTGQSGPDNLLDTNSAVGQPQIAVDAAGDVWIPLIEPGATPGIPGGVAKIPPYGGIGTTDIPAGGFNYSAGNDPFRVSGGIAVDGSGVVWVGDAGAAASGGIGLTPPNLGGYNSTLSLNQYGYASPSLANGPLSVAVDSSGNAWVLLNNNTVTEFVGIATPSVTPLSLAVKNKKLGAKP